MPSSIFRWIFALSIFIHYEFSATAFAEEQIKFQDHTIQFRGKPFRVLEVDLKRVHLALHWKDSQGQAYENLAKLRSSIRASGQHFLAATNAGIYSKQMKPLGLHIENGKQLVNLNRSRGGGNFFLKPNGVFYLAEKGARIIETSRFAVESKKDGKITEATQSGPILILDRKLHPSFKTDSVNRKSRSGIGLKDPWHIVIALSEELVTFEEIASLFRDRLGCSDALYLDGTISRILGENDPPATISIPYVGMIALFEKKERQ